MGKSRTIMTSCQRISGFCHLCSQLIGIDSQPVFICSILGAPASSRLLRSRQDDAVGDLIFAALWDILPSVKRPPNVARTNMQSAAKFRSPTASGWRRSQDPRSGGFVVPALLTEQYWGDAWRRPYNSRSQEPLGSRVYSLENCGFAVGAPDFS